MKYSNITEPSGKKDIAIQGFRQNFKYFEHASTLISELFTLNEELQNYSKAVTSAYSGVRVGVHIRLGDLMEQRIINYGYVMAQADFYRQSMDYFVNKFSPQNVTFLALSDSINKAKELLANLTHNIAYIEGGTMEQDFATLIACDHIITSGGTFGFWAAWLNRGKVVYFSEYCRPNSTLASKGYCRECFNLPQWIPMGNTILSQ